MKSIFFLFGVLVVSVAGSLAGGSAIWLFWSAWKDTDLEAFRALVGGFAGAFFAYIFVRFGDALKKIADRKELNHTNLVKVQHYFNDCLNTTHDNKFIVNDQRRIFTAERRASPESLIYMNKFLLYSIDRDLVINLTNTDFINEVVSLNVGLRKLNDSLATIDLSYAQLRDAFLAKNIDADIYKENAWQYHHRCLEIEGFLTQTKSDLVRLFAVANLLLQERPFFVRILQALVRSKYPGGFDAKVKIEKAKVQSEMDVIAKASARRIEEAQKR
jgi:hypothetical protein